MNVGRSFGGAVNVDRYAVATEGDDAPVEDLERLAAVEHRIEAGRYTPFTRFRAEEPLDRRVRHEVARRPQPILPFEHVVYLGLGPAHLVGGAQVDRVPKVRHRESQGSRRLSPRVSFQPTWYPPHRSPEWGDSVSHLDVISAAVTLAIARGLYGEVIHRSAWNKNSRKFRFSIVHSPAPIPLQSPLPAPRWVPPPRACNTDV